MRTSNISHLTPCISVGDTLPIARANMLFYTKKVVTVAVVILMTIALCSANKQDVRMQFVKKKVLHTTYATKETNSELNCARWCLKDKQLGKCKMAGYNKYSKSCSLSMDNPADALDVNDEMSGIYSMEQEEGIIHFVITSKLSA